MSRRPSNWYAMSYTEQREWESNERAHQDELYYAEQREREARDEADRLDRHRRRELASAREERADMSAEIDRLCELCDELRSERDELRQHRDDLVQLVSEALEALHENPSINQIDLRDWIKSAKAAIATTKHSPSLERNSHA